MQSKRVVAIVLASCFAAGVQAVVAQNAEQKPAEAPKTAAEQYKNIQILKTVPAEDLLPTMRYMGASLGVECGFCHVSENGRLAPEKDDKREKQTAREMMKMVMTINQENFDGRQQVSCNSCHNGHTNPSIVPAVATEESLKERSENESRRGPGQAQAGQGQAGQPPQREARPTAESLFQKYEEAIGGTAAIDRITSRYVKGTISTPQGSQDFEQYNKAPGKSWLSRTGPHGTFVQAFDGTQGWTRAGDRVEPLSDISELKINSDFYRSLKFAGRYQGARVFRKEKVGDHDAWVVMVRDPNSPLSDLLYFDVDSGLLVRRTTLRRTGLGPLPTTTDLSDYRNVDGVKMPYKVTISTPTSIQNVQVTEMKANIPVEDTRFDMPKEASGQ